MTRASTHDRGMTLVEVVVAMVVLGILAAATLAVILKAQESSVDNRSRVAASNLAAREIDIVRGEFERTTTAPRAIADAGTVTNPHPLTGGVTGQPLEIDGTPYTVVRSVAWNVVGNGASACDGGALVSYPSLGVTVTVTWPGMNGVAPVVSRTVLAPEKGASVPSTSAFVAVRVVDSAGEPSAGRSVVVASTGESRAGRTDASGCAVLEVTPGPSGTAYTAQVSDPGYVDISGTPAPAKPVGTIGPGTLSSGVQFAYDRAATVQLRLVDVSGTPLADSAVPSGSITLVAAESAGGDGRSSVPVAGVVTPVTGRWPTQYGAYLGATPPAGGYVMTTAAPGATVLIDVPVGAATALLTDLPDGTTSVIAAPAAVASCTGAGAREVDPAGFTVIPGSWSFYASGPAFACSPGPSGVSLADGPNDGIAWAATTLRVVDAPAGTLWAVSRSRTGADTLTTCPGAAYAAVAVPVDGARTASLTLPAGDWWVYLTDGAADGACLGTPGSEYPKQVAYGTSTTLSWPPATATLTMTEVPNASVYLTTTASSRACTAASSVLMGTGPSRGSTTLTTTVNRPASGTTTYLVYKRSGTTCSAGGSYVVGPATTALTRSYTSTGPVGP